jgi:hypothetical protein
MPPKWFTITKNEYLVRTSSVRQIRPFFPFIVIGILAIYVAFIAPAIIDAILDDPVEFLLSQIAVFLVPYFLFMFFFMFIAFPISGTLKDVRKPQQEIFLSAPVKASDVLLGEFFGELPLFAIVFTLITGFFTALLMPVGLNMIQMAIIVIIFIVTFSSGVWIGTVISALLRTRLGRSASGRDIGKALSILIVLPAVALMYSAMAIIDPGTGRTAIVGPEANGIFDTILELLPTSWGGDIIINFAAHPGDITALWFETVTKFSGLFIFFVIVVWIGVKAADRLYSLEAPSFISSRVRPDGVVYKTIKHRGSLGTLFITIFKMYIRSLQNLSYIFYVVGLLIIINIFLVEPGKAAPVAEMGFFFFPMIAAFVASDISMRGKETLFIYRKAPSGENRFIATMIFKGWAVAGTVTFLIVITSLLLNKGSLISPLADIGLMVLIVAGDVLFASGLFLLIPAYTEKGGEFILDVMIVAMTSVGLFIVSLVLMKEIYALPFLHWVVGIVFLFLGKSNLNRIE